jgi:hypothetical protein
MPSQTQVRQRIYEGVEIKPRTRTKRVIADETLQDRYLAALPRYFTVSAALVAAAASMQQLRRWRERDGAFLIREQDARNALADKLEAEAIRRAFKGIRTPV